jgi:hypothetical protein
MLGKLPVALLLATAPALAAEPASNIKIDESGQAYRIKKVCRTVEVAGSFIPRTSCVSKKVPVKMPASEAQEAAKSGDTAADASGEGQKEQ